MNLPRPARFRNAWPFTAGEFDPAALGPLVLDGETAALKPPHDPTTEQTTEPVYHVGDRVIVRGTSGAPNAAIRQGGPGRVVEKSEPDEFGNQFLTVTLDDAPHDPQRYHACELKPAPTV